MIKLLAKGKLHLPISYPETPTHTSDSVCVYEKAVQSRKQKELQAERIATGHVVRETLRMPTRTKFKRFT